MSTDTHRFSPQMDTDSFHRCTQINGNRCETSVHVLITYLLLIHYRQLQLPDNEAPISPGALAQSTMGLEPPGASGAFFYRWLKPPAMMPTANNSGLQISYMKAH